MRTREMLGRLFELGERIRRTRFARAGRCTSSSMERSPCLLADSMYRSA
jgi:hypothetical protein